MKTARDIMTKNLKTVTTTEQIVNVGKMLTQHSIRHALVVDVANGKLMGIVSDRDIKKFISPFVGSPRESEQDKATLYIQVGKIMTKDVVTVESTAELKQIAEIMVTKKINAVPVIDEDGKATGLITTTDMLRQMIGML